MLVVSQSASAVSILENNLMKIDVINGIVILLWLNVILLISARSNCVYTFVRHTCIHEICTQRFSGRISYLQDRNILYINKENIIRTIKSFCKWSKLLNFYLAFKKKQAFWNIFFYRTARRLYQYHKLKWQILKLLRGIFV